MATYFDVAPNTTLSLPDSDIKYELSRKLGQGGFGQVWMAIATGGDADASGEQRAVKLSRTGGTVEFLTKAEVRKQSLAIQAVLDSTGKCLVPRLYESGIARTRGETPQEFVFLAMEFIHGQTASSLAAAAQGLPEDVCKVVLKEVCSGLKLLHQNDIVHSDIKGDNIMISASGDVKMCDFGGACVLGEGEESMAVGTKAFLPPELVAGRGRSTATDIWMLGMLAVELCMGQTAWDLQSTRRDPLVSIDELESGGYLPDCFRRADTSMEYQEFAYACLKPNEHERIGAAQLCELPLVKNVGNAVVRRFRAFAAEKCA